MNRTEKGQGKASREGYRSGRGESFLSICTKVTSEEGDILKMMGPGENSLRYKDLVEAQLLLAVSGVLAPPLSPVYATSPPSSRATQRDTRPQSPPWHFPMQEEGAEHATWMYLVSKHSSAVCLSVQDKSERAKPEEITFRSASLSFNVWGKYKGENATYVQSMGCLTVRDEGQEYRWDGIEIFPLDKRPAAGDAAQSRAGDDAPPSASTLAAQSDSAALASVASPRGSNLGLKEVWRTLLDPQQFARAAYAAFLYPDCKSDLKLGAFVVFDERFFPDVVLEVCEAGDRGQGHLQSSLGNSRDGSSSCKQQPSLYSVIVHVSSLAEFRTTRFWKVPDQCKFPLAITSQQRKEEVPFDYFTYLPPSKVHGQQLSEGGFCFYRKDLPGIVVHSCFQERPHDVGTHRRQTDRHVTVRLVGDIVDVRTQRDDGDQVVDNNALPKPPALKVRVCEVESDADPALSVTMFKVKVDVSDREDAEHLQIVPKMEPDEEDGQHVDLPCFGPDVLDRHSSQRRRRTDGLLARVLNGAIRSLCYEEQNSISEALQVYMDCIHRDIEAKAKVEGAHKEHICLKVREGLDSHGIHKPQKRFFTQHEVSRMKGARTLDVMDTLLRHPRVEASLKSYTDKFVVCRQCTPHKSFWKDAMCQHINEEHSGKCFWTANQLEEELGKPNSEYVIKAENLLPKYWMDVVLKAAATHADVFVDKFRRESERYSKGRNRCAAGCLCSPLP